MIIKNWFSHELAEALKQVIVPNFPYLEYDDVEMYSPKSGVDIVATRGVETHTDKNFPRYSVMLIHKNTGLIAKGSLQKEDNYLKQIPGTIIIIDIHNDHHCISDSRFVSTTSEENNEDNEIWVTHCVEYKRKSNIPSKKRIEQIFLENLCFYCKL